MPAHIIKIKHTHSQLMAMIDSISNNLTKIEQKLEAATTEKQITKILAKIDKITTELDAVNTELENLDK